MKTISFGAMLSLFPGNKMQPIVYVKLPRTGLGNMLLVWARAFVFAESQRIPVVTSSWVKIHYGAWLRNERKKRLYRQVFLNNNLGLRICANIRYHLPSAVRERELLKGLSPDTGILTFVFDEISVGNDLFAPLKEYRPLIKDALHKMLHPRIKAILQTALKPVMALHIRRGDFKFGNPITENQFFIDIIRLTRETLGYDLPVTIYSDAQDNEIQTVLSLPSVARAPDNPDIVDILMMSKSKILVLSRSSTFSYWSAFLSDALIIKPHADWQNEIRPAHVNAKFPEIKIDLNVAESVAMLKQSILQQKQYILA